MDVPRTTNAVEGYHNALNALFLAKHPTVWTLLRGLQRDIGVQRKVYADSLQINNNPPRGKYVLLTQRLAAKVQTYQNDNNKLQYLRSVAIMISSA